MPGCIEIFNFRTGPKCLYTRHPVSCLRINWLKRAQQDRSLCLVLALRYYLDRTKDLCEGKDLVFVSFRKSFQKDIIPATISSWIKQTVLLCYQLSDEEAQNLHQVRAHDVRAFAASTGFRGGVSLDQILSACHWKAHNTFTQFYLKDVAWADSELYHLGPIVAARQFTCSSSVYIVCKYVNCVHIWTFVYKKKEKRFFLLDFHEPKWGQRKVLVS